MGNILERKACMRKRRCADVRIWKRYPFGRSADDRVCSAGRNGRKATDRWKGIFV